MSKKVKPQPYEEYLWLKRRVMAVQGLANEVVDANKRAQADLQAKIALQRENKVLRSLMQEAIDNCETCRNETGARRCARCQTFEDAIVGIHPDIMKVRKT